MNWVAAAAALGFLYGAFSEMVRAKVPQEPERLSEGISSLMSGIEAAGRALYGGHVDWDWDDMDTYDSQPDLREDWEQEAEFRIYEKLGARN